MTGQPYWPLDPSARAAYIGLEEVPAPVVVGPGDHLVVGIASALNQAQHVRLEEWLRDRLGVPVTVITNVRQLAVLRAEQVEEVEEVGGPADA